MQETDSRSTETTNNTLADIVSSGGPMEERKALGIISALCGRQMENAAETADLRVICPHKILLSSDGKLTFSSTSAEPYQEAYLPPEYIKGVTSDETAAIYGLGILLLFLVTGQEKKSGMDARIKNPVVRETIVRCTALDSRRRFQSLPELRAFLNRELRFPKKRIQRTVMVLALCLAAAVSVYMYISGRNQGEAEGKTAGYKNGYQEGYEEGTSDAPGIGIESAIIPSGYGNLSGNLNTEHGPFAVYTDESICYIKDGKIYQMDPYTKKTGILAEHNEVYNLNFNAGYLYYVTESGVQRLEISSRKEETVSDSILGSFCICEGTLYLDDEKGAGYLYGIDTGSLDVKQLNAKTEYACLNVTDRKLFYSDPEMKGYLFSCDHDGGNVSRLLSRPCRDIDLCGGRIYCLTTNENSQSEISGNISQNTLISMDPEGGDMEILTNQPIRRFIATETGIFYIPESSGYLEWMTLDGKTRYTVCASPVSDFNIAGRWIFYKKTGDRALYRMRINGSDTERL